MGGGSVQDTNLSTFRGVPGFKLAIFISRQRIILNSGLAGLKTAKST